MSRINLPGYHTAILPQDKSLKVWCGLFWRTGKYLQKYFWKAFVMSFDCMHVSVSNMWACIYIFVCMNVSVSILYVFMCCVFYKRTRVCWCVWMCFIRTHVCLNVCVCFTNMCGCVCVLQMCEWVFYMDASVCPCARVQLSQPAVAVSEAAAEAAVAAVHKERLLCTRRGCCTQRKV